MRLFILLRVQLEAVINSRPYDLYPSFSLYSGAVFTKSDARDIDRGAEGVTLSRGSLSTMHGAGLGPIGWHGYRSSFRIVNF